MRTLLRHDLGRFFALLSVALLLTFAAASIACTLDDFQHMTLSSDDGHAAFGSFATAVEADHTQAGWHAGEHGPAIPFDGEPAEHPAGHHHHWDNVSGTLSAMVAGNAPPLPHAVRPEDLAQHDPAGFAVLGLERPPKASLTNA